MFAALSNERLFNNCTLLHEAIPISILEIYWTVFYVLSSYNLIINNNHFFGNEKHLKYENFIILSEKLTLFMDFFQKIIKINEE
jgi:hypothetical protein